MIWAALYPLFVFAVNGLCYEALIVTLAGWSIAFVITLLMVATCDIPEAFNNVEINYAPAHAFVPVVFTLNPNFRAKPKSSQYQHQ